MSSYHARPLFLSNSYRPFGVLAVVGVTSLTLALACLGCHKPLRNHAGGGAETIWPKRPANDDGLAALEAELGVPLAPAKSISAQGPLDRKAVHRLAVHNSPDVMRAEALLEQARANGRAQGLWPNPSLEGRVLMDMDGGVGGEAALLFSLPVGGRTGAAKEQAAAALALASGELKLARRAAMLEGDRLMDHLAHHRARLELYRELAQRSRENGSLARSRLSASMADSVDVALLLAEAAHDRRAVARARYRVVKAEGQLRSLLGLRPHQGLFQVAPLRRFKLQESEESFQASSLEAQMDVVRAALNLNLADRRAARVAAERIPDLNLGPALTAGGEGVALGLALGIGLPILDSGKAAYERAIAQRSSALVELRTSQTQALAKLEQASQNLKARQQELAELSGEPEQLVAEAKALAEVRYRAGKLDVLRLLSIYRAHLSLKVELLDLLLESHLALLQLQEVVGRPIKTVEVTQ